MEFDIDYEIDKYIDEQADQYVELDELLKQNHLTFDEAQQRVKQFKEKFYSLLSKYSISNQNLVKTCYDLMECISQQPDNVDLQYLYLCIMTDFGLLNEINAYDRTEEQEIRNYLEQNKLVQELESFLKLQSDNSRKLNELREYLTKPIQVKHIECTEESDLLYQMTIQHTFLYESVGNEIYKDNLNALLMYINSYEKLRRVKPYVIFAVLARKTGMMQNREHFIPNLKAVFQYQDYNIYRDNGKNFNQYHSALELYDQLRKSYFDDNDIDIAFCDFCFANLSPLSEWYYLNCEQNEDIPMTLARKILTVMPDSFPMLLSYEDYGELNEDEIQMYSDAEGKLKEKMLRTAEKFLKL